jgi:uncharacterized protein YfaP (DUF2135 family)
MTRWTLGLVLLACLAARGAGAQTPQPTPGMSSAPTSEAPSPKARAVDRPAGGWVYDGLSDAARATQYAYPANLIDRGGQRGRTLIQGHLETIGKAVRTPLLVVNGNVLPLYTGSDGRFARPYVFGAGSNGIEVRDAQGRTVQRTQFIEANRLKTQAKVRVILAWDDPHAELDLHVLTPDGGHAFFAQPELATGGGLDLDSVDGAGPEMFSVTAPLSGTYHVYVNYWGRFGDGGYHFDENDRRDPVITARISVVYDENTGAERRETFTVPMRKIGDLIRVRSFLR